MTHPSQVSHVTHWYASSIVRRDPIIRSSF